MYITIENEIITGVYCGDKKDGFIEVPDTFNGYVGCSVSDFDSSWNLIHVQSEPMPEPVKLMTLEEEVNAGLVQLPKGAVFREGKLYQMSLTEMIEAGLEKLPAGFKIKDDYVIEMDDIEKMIAGLKSIPEGYEIVENKLVEIITPEKLVLIELLTLQAYLDSTDWYVTRYAETGKAIPEDILAQRSAARERISELRVKE
jgi:hypothetical protein